ncbi:hypothetical protein [Accumulibacter sp.]|uniref:hypothetical protein n=1 Tax=Accumulibacter sp. TaxID=2053492 RepID=UPI0035AE3A3B
MLTLFARLKRSLRRYTYACLPSLPTGKSSTPGPGVWHTGEASTTVFESRVGTNDHSFDYLAPHEIVTASGDALSLPWRSDWVELAEGVFARMIDDTSEIAVRPAAMPVRVCFIRRCGYELLDQSYAPGINTERTWSVHYSLSAKLVIVDACAHDC